MIMPPSLKPGDTIGVMAPSSYVENADLLASKEFLEQRGYKVFIHPQTFARHHQSAGTNEQKRDAFHELVIRDDISAVVFAAGGNRALHLLDDLDYNLIAAHPKIYMGFSDCTVLLNTITVRTGLITYHGPALKRFATNNQMDFTLGMLSGNQNTVSLSDAKIIHTGAAQGRLYGGNLATFSALLGSKDMPDVKGAILFFEDVNENLSRIDRYLCSFKRAGILGSAAALIFGQFSGNLESGRPFGFSLEDIIREHTVGLNIPVLMNAPFGHGDDLPAFPIGAKAHLDGTKLNFLGT